MARSSLPASNRIGVRRISQRAFALALGAAIAAVGVVLAWQLNLTIQMARDDAQWMDWSQQLRASIGTTSLVVKTLDAGGQVLLNSDGMVSVPAVNGLGRELRDTWADLPEPPGAPADFVANTRQAVLLVNRVAAQLDRMSGAAAAGQTAAALKILADLRQAPSVAQLPDMLQNLSDDGRKAWQAHEQSQGRRLDRAFWVDLTGVEALVGLLVALLVGLGQTAPPAKERPTSITTRGAGIPVPRDRAPDRLLNMVGHDLRQPLQALGSFISALERVAGRPELLPMIDGMRSAATSMDRMIRNLLDMSRLDSGRIVPELEEFDISAVIDPIRRELVGLAAEKGLDFRVSLIPGRVHTDAILLESILRNLVVNAIKYTSKGQVELRVVGKGAMLTIDVEDTGTGIPQEEIGRIFDEFYRSETTKRVADGLGLGLAVARRTAALLGLTIRVQSLVGRGSTFSVDIPRASFRPPVTLPGAASLARDYAPPPPAAGPHEMLRGLKLLVVDDDAAIRRAVAADLEPLGVAVTAAADAEETCALFQQDPERRFDFALVDMHLGRGMTGVDLLDHLASRYAVAVPALVMTGASDPDVLRELRRADYPWVPKPLPPGDLIQWIATLLGSGIGVNDERRL